MIARRRRGGRSGRAVLTAMAFQASANADGQTITCPAVQAGDLIVLADQAVNNPASTPTNVVPAGFSSLQTSAGAFTRVTLSMKIAAGDESGIAISGMLGTFDTPKVLLVFRPTGVISSIAASTFLEQTTDGNPTAQAIAAAGHAAPLIRLAVAALGSTSATAPAFSAGTFDATVARNGVSFAGGLRAGYAVQNTSPTDDTPDIGDNGSGNCLMTGWLSFT